MVPFGFGNGLTVLCGISLGFYRVLLGFTPILLFIGTLLGQWDIVVSDFTLHLPSLPGFTGFHWMLRGFTEF